MNVKQEFFVILVRIGGVIQRRSSKGRVLINIIHEWLKSYPG